MVNYVLIGLIAAILGISVTYIRREKRKGRKCIGCPYSGACAGGCGCKE